jgi:hypothetical protein
MDSTWIVIIDQIVIPVIVAVVAPILIVLAKKALDVFQEKTGIQVAEAQRKMLEGLIDKGIAYAEEQARKAVKKGGDELDGESKLELAVDFISTNAAALGLDAKADDLAKLIESKLYADREDNTVEAPEEDDA